MEFKPLDTLKMFLKYCFEKNNVDKSQQITTKHAISYNVFSSAASERETDTYLPTVIGITATVGGLALILALILMVVIYRRRSSG